MNIRVVNHEEEYVTRHCDKTDEWDRDDTSLRHDIKGIIKVDTKGYYDLPVAFDVEDDKSYYLIYVLYDTGNSFGRDENRIMYIDLFENKKNAKELVRLIKKNHADVHDKDDLKFDDKYSMRYLNEAGSEIVLRKAWEGYFERFIDCIVQEVELIEE